MSMPARAQHRGPIVTALPADGARRRLIAGTTVRSCTGEACGTRLAVTPASLRMVIAGARLLCVPCAVKEARA